LLVLAGCNPVTGSNNNSSDSTKAPAKVVREAVQSKLSGEGTGMLMAMVSKYYALKNALVATKAPKVDTAAMELNTAADNMMAFFQKDSANAKVLKPYMDSIISQNKMIMTIKDESCEKQRLAFGMISSAIYGLLKNVEIKNAGIYHEYCPMAFNEKGAFWLSDESEIKNPYFGKKMLECGEVTDSL